MTDAATRSELEALLAETPADAAARQRHAFDEAAAGRESGLVLFGAAGLGRWTLARLRALGIEPLAFADNDRRLWGREVEGLEVLEPAEAVSRHGEQAPFVVTTMRGCVEGTSAAAVREQLSALGEVAVLPAGLLYWRHPEAFLPYYFVGEPSAVLDSAGLVRCAFDSLADERSRREFVAHVRCRLTLRYEGTGPDAMEDIYFPRDLFRLRDDEVFVDCGAFDGEAVARLAAHAGGRFRRIVALEPDPASFTRVQDAVAALPPDTAARVTLLQAAVGATEGTASFTATGSVDSALTSPPSPDAPSAPASACVTVTVVTLDGTLSDPPPTFVKMDVEGGEADALRGGAALIARHAPLLAVSAYHRPEDVWELVLLISSIRPGYRFHLRPYMDACFDTVLYAVPEDRET